MRCRFVKEIFHNKENGFCIFVVVLQIKREANPQIILVP